MEQVNNLVSKNKLNMKNHFPPKFICNLCDNVIEKVKATKCCHRFCGRCITEYLSQNNQCPDCGTLLNAETDVSNDFAFDFKVGKLEVNCPNKCCDVKICMAELREHINGCTNTGSGCTLARLGCGSVVKSNHEMEQHLSSELVNHFELLASDLSKFHDETQIRIRNLNESLAELTRENGRLREGAARFEERNIAVKKAMDETRKENGAVRKELNDFRKENAAVKRAVDGVRNEKADAMKAVNGLKKENAAIKKVIDGTRKENGNLKREIEKIAAGNRETKAGINDKKAELNQKIETSDSEIKEMRHESRARTEGASANPTETVQHELGISGAFTASVHHKFSFNNVTEIMESSDICYWCKELYLHNYKFTIWILRENEQLSFRVCLGKGMYDEEVSWPLKRRMRLKVLDADDSDKVFAVQNFSYETENDGCREAYNKPHRDRLSDELVGSKIKQKWSKFLKKDKLSILVEME